MARRRRPRTAVGAAAVVEETVVEGHVSLGNVPRNLLDHGAVSFRVTVQEIIASHVPRITDRPGGAVPMPPAVASVHHGDRARFLGAVVERNEGSSISSEEQVGQKYLSKCQETMFDFSSAMGGL